jgi:hypothetical protein
MKLSRILWRISYLISQALSGVMITSLWLGIGISFVIGCLFGMHDRRTDRRDSANQSVLLVSRRLAYVIFISLILVCLSFLLRPVWPAVSRSFLYTGVCGLSTGITRWLFVPDGAILETSQKRRHF